ncbi:hypothetical protein CRYUN_Cryun06bG0078100 [Craigia yunnanensis]
METEKKQSSAVSDMGAWAMNVTSSVGLIMADKQLMSPSGYAFVFLLVSGHTGCSRFKSFSLSRSPKSKNLSCFYGNNINWVPLLYDRLNRFGVKCHWLHNKKNVPLWELLWFSIVANTSITGMNLSLMLNSVGFYQISKLSMIPVVCVMEWILHGKQYSSKVKIAIIVVVVGVGVCTVTDVKVNAQGFLCAFVAVVSSSLQQISIGSIQKKYSIGSFELLSQTAPIHALSLLLLGPFVDYFLSGKLLASYKFSSAAFFFVLLSFSLAVFCNISQYLCIGRFSAVSFQVLGHMKTICVLILGWLLFDSELTLENILGMAIAILGMVVYSWAVEADKQTDSKFIPFQKDTSEE